MAGSAVPSAAERVRFQLLPAALVGVLDEEGDLGLLGAWEAVVAAHADQVVAQQDDEGDPVDVVDVGEAVQVLGRQLPDGAEEAVFSLLSDITIRHRLDDCADIPENHQYPLSYTMSATQRRAYEEMAATQLLNLGKAGGITAINTLPPDYDLCLRLSERFEVGHLAKPLYRYRIRRDSISQGNRLSQVKDSFEAAKCALTRRKLDTQYTLALGIRAKHVLRPKAKPDPGT